MGATDEQIQEAYKLGCEHARNAASWITDGNDSDESRRVKLQRIEDDGEEFVTRPNLSGEFADDPTPLSLARDIAGDQDDYPDDQVMDDLADAYEEGVSETFEGACVAELNRWLS